VKQYRHKDWIKPYRLYRIGPSRNVQSRNVRNISSNFFLSDFLSKVLRNGFHSSSSIASAILKDGIVLTHTLLTAYTYAMPPSTNNSVPVM
jgi:hypothetical protein